MLIKSMFQTIIFMFLAYWGIYYICLVCYIYLSHISFFRALSPAYPGVVTSLTYACVAHVDYADVYEACSLTLVPNGCIREVL